MNENKISSLIINSNSGEEINLSDLLDPSDPLVRHYRIVKQVLELFNKRQLHELSQEEKGHLYSLLRESGSAQALTELFSKQAAHHQREVKILDGAKKYLIGFFKNKIHEYYLKKEEEGLLESIKRINLALKRYEMLDILKFEDVELNGGCVDEEIIKYYHDALTELRDDLIRLYQSEEKGLSIQIEIAEMPEYEFKKHAQKLAWLFELGILTSVMDRAKIGETYNTLGAAKIICSFTDLKVETVRKCLEAIFPRTTDITTNKNITKNNPLNNPANLLFISEMKNKFHLP